MAQLLHRLHQKPNTRVDAARLRARTIEHGAATDEASASVVLKPLLVSCLLPLLPEAFVAQLLRPE